MSPSARLYAHASKDLGLHELPGPASQPRIAQAIRVSADWLNPDDSKTAWCGCIRGLWGLETGTGVPTAHYRAASWLMWGRIILRSEAQQGDTVVLHRTGGYHVALLDHFSCDGKSVWLLGGNQGNAVTVAAYDVAKIEGIRRGS
jgi:uncharacterized protein (TIGR02594 family)